MALYSIWGGGDPSCIFILIHYFVNMKLQVCFNTFGFYTIALTLFFFLVYFAYSKE